MNLNLTYNLVRRYQIQTLYNKHFFYEPVLYPLEEEAFLDSSNDVPPCFCVAPQLVASVHAQTGQNAKASAWTMAFASISVLH